MRALIFTVLLFGSIGFALGQPHVAPQPAAEQALGQEVLSCLQGKLQASTSLITANAEIAKLKAEIEALKKPAEPK